MDINQIQFLSNEQKERYMTLERLFEAPGWKLIVEWAKANGFDQTQRQLNAVNWDQTNVARGARYAFGMLEELQATTEAEFAALAAQNAETAGLTDEQTYE